MCTYTHAEASSEPYLITILLIVQPVGVARGGEKESKTVSFREGQRERERRGVGGEDKQGTRASAKEKGEHEHSTKITGNTGDTCGSSVSLKEKQRQSWGFRACKSSVPVGLSVFQLGAFPRIS